MSVWKKTAAFLSMLFFAGLAKVSAAYTGTVDYVSGVSTVWDKQFSTFLDLLNSPIGYLLAFVLGIGLLKWMGLEIASFTKWGGWKK